MTGKYPRCPDCGGAVELMAKPGRTREEFVGIHLPIPDDLELPCCTRCGEPSMNCEDVERLRKRWLYELSKRLGWPS